MATLFQVKPNLNHTQDSLLSPAQISAIMDHAKDALKKACVNRLQHTGTHLRSAAFFNPKAAIVLDTVAAQVVTEISGQIKGSNISLNDVLAQVISTIQEVVFEIVNHLEPASAYLFLDFFLKCFIN